MPPKNELRRAIQELTRKSSSSGKNQSNRITNDQRIESLERHHLVTQSAEREYHIHAAQE